MVYVNSRTAKTLLQDPHSQRGTVGLPWDEAAALIDIPTWLSIIFRPASLLFRFSEMPYVGTSSHLFRTDRFLKFRSYSEAQAEAASCSFTARMTDKKV
jgi:hypothetical protein